MCCEKTSKALMYQAKAYDWLDYEAMHNISGGSQHPLGMEPSHSAALYHVCALLQTAIN
jgi:hypothetical protein